MEAMVRFQSTDDRDKGLNRLLNLQIEIKR